MDYYITSQIFFEWKEKSDHTLSSDTVSIEGDFSAKQLAINDPNATIK